MDIRNFSIRNKLILVLAIPMIVLFYYLQLSIRENLEKRKNSKELLVKIQRIQLLEEVVHEIQKERALALSFLATSGLEGKDQYFIQRDFTDNVISELRFKKEVDNEISLHIEQLPKVRQKVLTLSVDNNAYRFYNSFKYVLLDRVTMVLREAPDLSLKNQFEDHLLLLYSKDFLAQTRSVFTSVISKEDFGQNEYGEFSSIKGKLEINLHKLKTFSSGELRKELEKKLQSDFSIKTFRLIDSMFYYPDIVIRQNNFSSFWEVTTASINSFKELEDISINEINEQANLNMKESESNLIMSIAVAVMIFTLIVIIVAYIIRGIVDSLNKIKIAADMIAKGNVDVKVNVESGDEIGELAVSFNKMIAVTNDYVNVADRIGKGIYSGRLEPRGEEDKLGIALDRMRTNLQRLSQENEIRTWLLTGNREINDVIRGEKDIRSLSGDLLKYICKYLNASVGAVYVSEGPLFVLSGSYAFSHRKGVLNKYESGEGLIGQSASEKKPIVFTDVPDDYIFIQSGLGNTIPRFILVYPFIYEERVKAVIEIGTVTQITDLQMEFLNTIAENVAIAIEGAHSRSETKELLEETQRQTEELETQQEELKQSNEELQEKTILLEKSEVDLKTQQEELQQTNEELEEKANILEEQKELLERAKNEVEVKARELEQISKYKSEFLANMSHELRTPLNSILILAQLLSDNKNKTLTDKEVSFAQNIHNSGTDLLNLINEILDLSKVESGKMDIEIEDVNYDDISKDISDMFTEMAKSKSINFEISFDLDKTVPIRTDRQRLEQILKNLLSNAFKFTGEGGTVRLEAVRYNGDQTFHNSSLNNTKNIVVFNVKDTGIGIPEDRQELIFEAFRQADGSTKRKFGGTGLGLSISKELAHILGGEIKLKSEEGKGSTFSLYLPLKYQDSSFHQNEVKSGKAIPGQISSISKQVQNDEINIFSEDDRESINDNDKVLLIIEDDIVFARTLLDFAREKNYKGIVATDGNTGLSYARHYKPDAIILDMKLPVMDGVEVLMHLKNDPQLRHVPVQIVSGYDKKKQGLELGAFDYLRKPIIKNQLHHALDKIEGFVDRKHKKLLVIEDNVSQSQAIVELIGNNDVKSYPAFSGEEAFDLMSREDFDCIILDLGLPDMSGFDLLERIKADSKLKQIPIIVYTGRDLTKEETGRLNSLANTVVLKTASSKERLLDETTLFLHRVESKLPKDKQKILRKLHKTDEVLKNKKVLVVDDDIRNIYSLTNVLENEGVQCYTAGDGKAALKVLKENQDIDIVLMDIMMPEMDGYEATKAIRKMERFKKLPIIALTAKAMKGDREKCLQASMSDYIAKPVDIDQLLSLMRVWLYK